MGSWKYNYLFRGFFGSFRHDAEQLRFLPTHHIRELGGASILKQPRNNPKLTAVRRYRRQACLLDDQVYRQMAVTCLRPSLIATDHAASKQRQIRGVKQPVAGQVSEFTCECGNSIGFSYHLVRDSHDSPVARTAI
ncbi:hypothetical protein GCM10027403_18420 [Arthrobacter tecti]